MGHSASKKKAKKASLSKRMRQKLRKEMEVREEDPSRIAPLWT
jgi:hypothetical protein